GGGGGVDGGVGDRADAAPRAAGGNEDRADEVKIELNGEDRVELAGIAERKVLDPHGVRNGRVLAGDVGGGGADGGERGGANAIVLSPELRDQSLRRGLRRVGLDELHRPHAGADGDDRCRRGWGGLRGRRRGGR